MAREKKKKSVARRIFGWLFGIIFSFILLIVGFSLYLYFAKGINVIATITELKVLNQDVNLTEISKNPWDEDDLISARSKIDTAFAEDIYLTLSDCELGAYINDRVQNSEEGIKANIGGVNVNLVEYGFEIVEMTFDIPEDTSQIWTNFKLITKIDTTKIKSEQLTTFPKNLIAKMIPNTIYIVSDVEIDKGEETDDYSVKSKSLSLNNLNQDQTSDLFKTLNTFMGLGDIDAFNKNISSGFVDAILGTNGLYGNLKENGANGYNFQESDGKNLFVTYMVDTSIDYAIFYENTKSATNPNKTSYKVTDGNIVLQDLSKEGYTFNGWFTAPNGGGQKVTQINSLRMESVTLYADWDLVEYTITYNLRGGSTSSPNRTKYTIETESFTLINPTKIVDEVDCVFLGWTGTDLVGTESTVTILKGSTGDRSYVARYQNEASEVKLNVDGKVVKSLEVAHGGKLNQENLENILSQSDVGFGGYSFSWYEDLDCTIDLDFNSSINEDKTIYAKSTYITNNIRFYPYLTEFQNSNSTKVLQIETYEKLKAYVDFVRFYDIHGVTSGSNVDYVKLLGFNYLSLLPSSSSANITANVHTIQDEVEKAYNEILATEYFMTSSAFSFPAGYDGQYYAGCCVTSSTWSSQAVNVFDVTKQKVYEQQDYALKLQYSSSRANSYDGFNVNNLSKEIHVSTSEQLVWVLENGYKPLPISGSRAESMYNKAKTVLRGIVDNNMTNVQKLKAIYEWLILNVQYDNEALEQSATMSASQAKTYDSWYLEGVFNNRKAVCEGFAKAFLVMSRIEGIPAIFVTGNNHAWNKVYIDGNWYAVDATHGNVEVSSPGKFEVVSYRTFMFKDSLRAGNIDPSKNYVATEYLSFSATTNYNFYENELFTYNATDYDLVIESQAELEALFNKAKAFVPTLDCGYYTAEFVVTDANNSSADSWILAARSATGLKYNTRYNSQVDSIGNHVYNIVIEK